MGILKKLLGKRDFYSSSEVKKSITRFERYDDKIENFEDSKTLLVFKSDTQQCWLVFSTERMYFVVDDAETDELNALWARDKAKCLVGGRINLHLKTKDKSSSTGVVLFGDMNKGFAYTKSLFESPSITGQIMNNLNLQFLKDLT